MTTSVLTLQEPFDGVLRATINRPGALNAINLDVMAALESLLDRLESCEDIRVFILTGQGDRAFISGGDLREFAPLTTVEDATRMSERMATILWRIEMLPCWTIAQINADAYGGGCETLAAFDFRYTHRDVHLGWTQAKFGLTPGWGGLTRLVGHVGRATALHWLATARRVSAKDAQAAGLIHEVAESAESLQNEIDQLCRRLVRQDRALIIALKQGARHLDSMTRQEAIDAERQPFAQLWASPTHHQRVAAFLTSSSKESV